MENGWTDTLTTGEIKIYLRKKIKGKRLPGLPRNIFIGQIRKYAEAVGCKTQKKWLMETVENGERELQPIYRLKKK